MARTAKKAAAPQQATRDPFPTPQNYPVLTSGMTFNEVGTHGLRQYSGWVREEFLPQLQGRQAVKIYREMLDNSASIGGAMMAIQGAIRKVVWRTDPADDTPAAQEMADFAESLRFDMSETWEDFIAEALSMLGYGFSLHEIVYKRRNGSSNSDDVAGSLYDDGYIGIRKLPIRGQDTILKWFFGENGQIAGATQQPYDGRLIDIPIEKCLLFRPAHHKTNPEGRSILRSCYINYHFVKRMQEQEAILLERLSGLPVVRVPGSLIDSANGGDATAIGVLAAYKKLVTNVRIDEQMGVLLPSDVFQTGTGAGTPQFDFKLESPQGGGRGGSSAADVAINRHKLDMASSLLADFIVMGHGARGAQNLGETKLDMFMQAVEGWLNSIAAVLNRYLLPRLWQLNGFDPDLMPQYVPDTAQRLDLDVLGAYALRLSQAGMPLFPDADLENFFRDVAGMPDISEDSTARDLIVENDAATQAAEQEHAQTAKPDLAGSPPAAPTSGDTAGPTTKVAKSVKRTYKKRRRSK
jgi:hypothetical protein